MNIRAFPFLAIVVALYFIITVFTGAGLAGVWFRMGLPSGAQWTVTTGDVLVFLALALLFVEMMIATASRATSILNHGLSMVVFIVCVLAFVLMPACGNSTFFVILLVTLVDVVAGYSISIVTARRDIALGQNA